MGYEYQLDLEVDDREKLDGILRSIVGFERYDAAYDLYYFRRKATGEMPDAHAKIDEQGLYLCDNGCGFAVLEDIRAALAAFAPGATLREL